MARKFELMDNNFQKYSQEFFLFKLMLFYQYQVLPFQNLILDRLLLIF
jgi:hypothetical protein